MRRALAFTALLTVAALVVPSGPTHATLMEALPTRSRARAPAEIRLHFNEVVTIGPAPSACWAGTEWTIPARRRCPPTDSSSRRRCPGSRAARGTRSAGARRARTATLRPASTTSASGSPPPPTEAAGASGTTWKDDLARWALFAALAVVIGPLVVRAAILRGDVPPAVERRFHLVPTVAAFAVIDVGIVVFLVRASNALQLPFGDLLYGDLQPFAEKTRFGVAFLVMTVGFAVVAALLSLACARPPRAAPACACALVLLVSGLSLSGHQATEPNSG